MLGLLGTLPLLAFAFASPLVHSSPAASGWSGRSSVSLLVLAIGTSARPTPALAGLWIGTVVIGAAIAVGNVLVPVILKRDYAANVSRATGVYTAFITGGAAIASLVAVPIANAAGWRLALAIWGGLAVLVALAWLPADDLAGSGPASADDRRSAAGRACGDSRWPGWSPFYMGLQSTSFYLLVNWLPTIEISTGVSERTAGVHIFPVPGLRPDRRPEHPLADEAPDQPAPGTITASLPILVALLGLLLLPQLALLWVVLAGLGQGAALVAALSLISIRGRSHHETTQLSGMAQAVGYLLAAGGPVAAGLIAEHTGGWDTTLIVFAALAAIQLTLGFAAGRDSR